MRLNNAIRRVANVVLTACLMLLAGCASQGDVHPGLHFEPVSCPHEFMRVEARQNAWTFKKGKLVPPGEDPPERELFCPAGWCFLVHVPNTARNSLLVRCGCPPSRQAPLRRSLGDMSRCIWKRLRPEEGRLYRSMLVGPLQYRLFQAPLALYVAPGPRILDGEVVFPAIPKKPVVIEATDAHSHRPATKLTRRVRVIGVAPDVKVTLPKDGKPSSGVRLEARVVPDTGDGKYDRLIAWYCNGRLCAHGKVVTMVVHRPGWHAFQAFVGLSGTRVSTENGTIFRLRGQGDRRQIAAVKRACVRSLRDRMARWAEKRAKTMAFIDRVGKQWGPSLPLNSLRLRKNGDDATGTDQTSLRCVFGNRSILSADAGDIHGWYSRPRDLPPGSRFAVCAGYRLRLNALGFDMDCLKSVSCPLCRTVSGDPAGRNERRLYGRLKYSWFTRGTIRLSFSRPHAPDPACQVPPNVHGRGAILLKLENEGNDPWSDGSVIVNHDVSVFCPGMSFSRNGPMPIGSTGRLRVYVRGRHGGAGSLRLTWNRKKLRLWQDGNRRSPLPLEVDAEALTGLRHTACLEFGLREWTGDMTLFVEGIEESTRVGDGLLRLEYIDDYGESIPYSSSPDEIRLTVIPGSPSG